MHGRDGHVGHPTDHAKCSDEAILTRYPINEGFWNKNPADSIIDCIVAAWQRTPPAAIEQALQTYATHWISLEAQLDSREAEPNWDGRDSDKTNF